MYGSSSSQRVDGVVTDRRVLLRADEELLRYLENALREDFELPGTPIRINIRKSSNPYADKG